MKLLIKSIDRTAGSTSSSDFKIELPTVVEGEFLVRYIHMPNALYNVVAGSNDTVYTSLGNATLTPGYYSASTFVTMLQTQLQVANVNFTATYNSDTKKITIANTGAFTLNFATTTASAAKLLGFANVNSASATSQVATNCINLIWSQSIVIDIRESAESILSTDVASSSRGTLLVPFTVAYGSLERISHNDLCQYVNLRRTKNLTIKLYDSDSNAASLNGADWEMFLESA